MKTYWLLTLTSERGGVEDAVSKDSVTGDAGGEEYVPKSSFMERIQALKESRASKERRIQRLVQWNSEMLVQLLKQVVARRQALNRQNNVSDALTSMARNIGNGCIVVDEVAEIIVLPEFNVRACTSGQSRNDSVVQLDDLVVSQVHSYVSVIASMYKDNPFHNFEHASHVTMSVSKLLSRIVAPQIESQMSDDEAQRQATLHDHTYGITSDPLTQFAVVLSALIHDVDHRGVPNFVLVNEEKALAKVYRDKSVAEQNSVDLAWGALMRDEYAELRACIFGEVSELKRFRQLLVNSVMATDIFDKELGAARKARWEKAFDVSFKEEHRQGINRKATIVIEHLIQASDVAHTMQHWHVYTKWNEKLFQEMYDAFRSGRTKNDPTENWYQGEIGFFDNYVIPLAKKLKNCGVFGVASDEYLNYALENRREWSSRGKEIVATYVEKHSKK
jgi:3'5'-cyclic nucleotide phosphodiesterase